MRIYLASTPSISLACFCLMQEISYVAAYDDILSRNLRSQVSSDDEDANPTVTSAPEAQTFIDAVKDKFNTREKVTTSPVSAFDREPVALEVNGVVLFGFAGVTATPLGTPASSPPCADDGTDEACIVSFSGFDDGIRAPGMQHKY